MGEMRTRGNGSLMNANFDILKFIMSYFVIGIYASPLLSTNKLVNTFLFQICSRVAVPTFFLLSSYFFFSSTPDRKKLKKWIKHLLSIFVFYWVIALPVTVYREFYLLADHGIGYCIRRYFLQCLFGSAFPGSWFMNALLFGVCLAFLLRYYLKLSYKIIFLIAIACHGLCSVASLWGGVQLPSEFPELYNSIIAGIFPCCMGAYLGELPRNTTHRVVHVMGSPVILVGLFFLLLGEYGLSKKFGCYMATDVAFMLMLMQISLFLNVKRINISLPIPISLALRKISTVNYFLHMNVLYFSLYFLKTDLTGSVNGYLLIVAVCLAEFFLINLISRISGCRFIKKWAGI